jgi:hypothetical protein
MVLVMKVIRTLPYCTRGRETDVLQLTAFCWNVHDGRLPESELSDFQKERAIRELPGLLDYAGYVVRRRRSLTTSLI